MPFVVSRVEAAAALSAVAAFVGADAGLGHPIQTSMASFRTSVPFGAVAIFALSGILLFQAVALVERILFPWSSDAAQAPPAAGRNEAAWPKPNRVSH